MKFPFGRERYLRVPLKGYYTGSIRIPLKGSIRLHMRVSENRGSVFFFFFGGGPYNKDPI